MIKGLSLTRDCMIGPCYSPAFLIAYILNGNAMKILFFKAMKQEKYYNAIMSKGNFLHHCHSHVFAILYRAMYSKDETWNWDFF
jgi:hypothetical protein